MTSNFLTFPKYVLTFLRRQKWPKKSPIYPLGGKYKISWSNDALESFLQIRALCAPHESITSQGAMADRVKVKLEEDVDQN